MSSGCLAALSVAWSSRRRDGVDRQSPHNCDNSIVCSKLVNLNTYCQAQSVKVYSSINAGRKADSAGRCVASGNYAGDMPRDVA